MPDLSLDPELIERLATVHEGNAKAHRELAESKQKVGVEPVGWSQHDMLSASSLVIAASYWSLIQPRKALALYRLATGIYRAIGHSYWMVLALASLSTSDIAKMLSIVNAGSHQEPLAIAMGMVGNETFITDGQTIRAERLTAEWRHIGNVPVGRLGISLDHYASFARVIHVSRSELNVERFFTLAKGYVDRAAEIIRSASHDRFHWQRLQSAILPAEPEGVALITVMAKISEEIFRMPITEMRSLDKHGQLLVNIGKEMLTASDEEQLGYRSEQS